MDKGQKIIRTMLENDSFSNWLGIELVEYKKDTVLVKMNVREEMNNGFSITHGGISYALADSAFAFLSNSYGRHAVSVDSSITHLAKVQTGDILWARAQKINKGNRISTFSVDVLNQNKDLISHFKGTVYISSKEWEV
jgi:acyl-CoA thioesterase